MKSLPLLSSHPRVRRWTAAVVASVIALGVCLASYDNVDAAIRQNRIERLNARIENVYTADYQNMADDKLEQGELYGMIKFGSCLEVVMPQDVAVTVKKGQKVTGGKTIIGRMKD